MAATGIQAEVSVKPRQARGVVVLWSVALVAATVIGIGTCDLRAQEKETRSEHRAAPQDWSSGSVIFTRDGLAKHPELIQREPRILQQTIQRWSSAPADGVRGLAQGLTSETPLSQKKSHPHRDWNVPALGGRISSNMYPAKFSFDPGAPPDCTNDYVVFGLNNPGVSANGNLVAFNNLYVDSTGDGLCTGTAPNVLFDYNITTAASGTGRINTSPILSLDGTKIAFVESVPSTEAIFHVLTWTAGQGNLTTSVTPTAAQMTSLTFSTLKDDTTSAPWIDYSNDTVYVGNDNGQVYKITGVFHGTPTLAGGNWPVTVSTNLQLTPPVLDSGLGLLMVGSANGSLYQIDTATGLVVATLVVGVGPTDGIVAPPIVDLTNGTTFVVDADDGSSGVLVEADTETLTMLAKARIGAASAGTPGIHLYQPAFNNDYYNDPSTGVVRVCGTGSADATPWQYAFGFAGRTMLASAPVFSQQLLTSTSARCTGWTEFFNPSVGPSGTDYFFFGLTQDCTTGGGFPDGCVVEITDANPGTLGTATIDGGTTGIVVDNYSTASQAANIYFSADKADIAYKFTQNRLQ